MPRVPVHRGLCRALSLVVLALVAILQLGPVSAEAATPRPAVSSVIANSGTTLGGSRITIRGAYFTGVRAVYFGASAGTAVRVLSSTALQVTTPRHAAGTVDVTVLAAGGRSPAGVRDHFVFVVPPSVTRLSVNHGLVTGGTMVTVTGAGFTRVTMVRFGAVRSTLVSVRSASTLIARAPASATANTVIVSVTTAYGTSPAVVPARFSYQPLAATVTAPAASRAGASLPLTGTYFQPGSTVHFLLHGTAQDLGSVVASNTGAFVASVLVPPATPAGTAQVESVGTDIHGAAVDVLTGFVVDMTPPTVPTFTATPGAVSPHSLVTFTAALADPSGVAGVSFDLRNDVTGVAGNCTSHGALISGTAASGVWRATCTLGAVMLNGAYTATLTGLDAVGNVVTTDTDSSVPKPSLLLSGGSANGSEAAPTVVSVTPSATTLTPGDPLTIDTHVTSPVGVYAVQFSALVSGSTGVAPICTGNAALISGTAADGVWEQTCSIPNPVLGGQYDVVPAVEDIFGVWVNKDGSATSPTHGTITVTSPYDYGAVDVPTVVDITVTPPDLHAGDQFTVSAHVTSPVGVSYTELAATADGVPTFCDNYAQLVSGTTTDGVWSMTCTVPSPATPASYTVTPYLADVLGQYVNQNGGPASATTGTFTVS
jgi:hypothetical protein